MNKVEISRIWTIAEKEMMQIEESAKKDWWIFLDSFGMP